MNFLKIKDLEYGGDILVNMDQVKYIAIMGDVFRIFLEFPTGKATNFIDTKTDVSVKLATDLE